jgi:hypothetical protein
MTPWQTRHAVANPQKPCQTAMQNELHGRSAERPYTLANFLLTSAKVLDEKSGIFDA